MEVVASVLGCPITLIEDNGPANFTIQPGWYVGGDNDPLEFGPLPTRYIAETIAVHIAERSY